MAVDGYRNLLLFGPAIPLLDGTPFIALSPNVSITEGKSDLFDKSEVDDTRANRRNDTRMNIVV